MNETVIQVDGKIVFVIPKKIIKSVCIPGKLVNLLTKTGDPDKLITCTEGVKAGKPFKRYKFGIFGNGNQ